MTMTEKKLYTCDICHTDYADKEMANKCEKSHKLIEKAVIVGEYKPITSYPDGAPYKIRVKFAGEDNWVSYKR